jgi:hypothetical protein
MSYCCGERQCALLAQRGGGVNLIYRDGAFDLHQSCKVETPEVEVPEEWLGVDLGIGAARVVGHERVYVWSTGTLHLQTRMQRA